MNTSESVATPAWRLALATALLALPMAGSLAAEMVVGSGKLLTETRAVSGFQAVELGGAMNLVLRQGPREGAEIRADHNLLPLIETRVVERSGRPTLVIDSRPGVSYSTRNELTVTVVLIDLKALTISGSGDARGDGLKTDTLQVKLTGSGNLVLGQLDANALDIRLSGSGNVQASGRASRVELVIEGSGSATLRGLEADNVGVRIDGSGDASVHARRTLEVAIAGSGDLRYAGEPSVTRSISGSGSIKTLRTP